MKTLFNKKLLLLLAVGALFTACGKSSSGSSAGDLKGEPAPEIFTETSDGSYGDQASRSSLIDALGRKDMDEGISKGDEFYYLGKTNSNAAGANFDLNFNFCFLGFGNCISEEKKIMQHKVNTLVAQGEYRKFYRVNDQQASYKLLSNYKATKNGTELEYKGAKTLTKKYLKELVNKAHRISTARVIINDSPIEAYYLEQTSQTSGYPWQSFTNVSGYIIAPDLPLALNPIATIKQGAIVQVLQNGAFSGKNSAFSISEIKAKTKDSEEITFPASYQQQQGQWQGNWQWGSQSYPGATPGFNGNI